jgi:hypothetical protein
VTGPPIWTPAPHLPASGVLALGLNTFVPSPICSHQELARLAVHVCGEAQRGRRQARHVRRCRLGIGFGGLAGFGGGEPILRFGLDHRAARGEPAQGVPVDRVLDAGELLIGTAEWAEEIGQHQLLQFVPDLPRLRHGEH